MSKERIDWNTDVISFETIRLPKYRDSKSGWLDPNALSMIFFALLFGALMLFGCELKRAPNAAGKTKATPTRLERR